VSKPEFLANVRSARDELEGVLAGCDEWALTRRPVPGLDWTAKDVLAHLIGYDLAVLEAIADVRATGTWTWPWTAPNFDPWNESTVGPRRALSYAAVRSELDDSRLRLLAELERWPEVSGPFGRDTWDLEKSPIQWIGPHERDHAEMIAKL
jgi:hypothetical protein